MCKNLKKRLQPRTELNGYTADIILSGFVFTATVHDASLEGVQLRNLPPRFSPVKNEKFTIIVSSFFEKTHYKLNVSFQWMKKNSASLIVGFRVANAPVIWDQFINKKTFDTFPLNDRMACLGPRCRY